jgi:hypothetical protein
MSSSSDPKSPQRDVLTHDLATIIKRDTTSQPLKNII